MRPLADRANGLTYFARTHYYFLSWKLELFFSFTETNGESKAHGRGLRIGEGYNPIGCNRRKIRRLRIEMVGFIEAAKRNILSFRAVLVSYEE